MSSYIIDGERVSLEKNLKEGPPEGPDINLIGIIIPKLEKFWRHVFGSSNTDSLGFLWDVLLSKPEID